MFYTKPVGKFVLQVCRTLSCALNGAERVTEEICGEARHRSPARPTPSGTFTLLEVECLGACDRAPVVMVNDAWHECLKPEDAAKLIDDLRARGEAALTGCHHRDRAEMTRPDGTKTRITTLDLDSLVPSWLRGQPVREMEPLLTKYVREPNAFTLDFYLKHEGYDGLRKALAHEARRGHRDGEGVGPARPRRRRVSRPA